MRALPWLSFLLLTALPQAEDEREIVRSAIRRTGERSYAYTVGGRFERKGEFRPPDLLTARIGAFRSVRRGKHLLIKGPEGLWRTLDERLGEKVEKPGKDEADIMKTLEEAEAPHLQLLARIEATREASQGDDRDAAGIPCHCYLFKVPPEELRAEFGKQIDKAVERGTLERPERVQWETARGILKVYVPVSDRIVLRFTDERSVKMEVKGAEGNETRLYRNEMEFTLSGHGSAAIDLPPEVKEKLGLK